jgi:hypothetical protein
VCASLTVSCFHLYTTLAQVARDLFRYMASFSQGGSATPETLVVPTNILDRSVSGYVLTISTYVHLP